LILIYRPAPQLSNLQPCLSGTKYRNFGASDGRFNHSFLARHSSILVSIRSHVLRNSFSLKVVQTWHTNSGRIISVYNRLSPVYTVMGYLGCNGDRSRLLGPWTRLLLRHRRAFWVDFESELWYARCTRRNLLRSLLLEIRISLLWLIYRSFLIKEYVQLHHFLACTDLLLSTLFSLKSGNARYLSIYVLYTTHFGLSFQS
jgi:hypothetical protein